MHQRWRIALLATSKGLNRRRPPCYSAPCWLIEARHESIPPENRIQLSRVDRIGPGKVHLGRLLRPRSLLVVHLKEKSAAQVLIIGLIRRLRSGPSGKCHIAWAGLLAGTLDITVAFIEAGLKGKSPVYLLQAIAGGLLGMSSFQGGLATAVLGAFFHFLIATTAAAVFYLASRKLKFMVQHAIPSGLLYGVAVYIFMSYIVLPISAYHTKFALPSVTDVCRRTHVHGRLADFTDGAQVFS